MRNEKKIVLSHEQYLLLASRIRAILPYDPHCTDPEGYWLSSLYFDDLHDSAYHEKMAGAAERKKYRIRIYNGDLSHIKLECKQKHADRIEKISERLSSDAYAALLDGDPRPLADAGTPLCREVYALCRDRLLLPRVVVAYRREAYLHPLSNTRITFDKQLHAGYTPAAMQDPEAAPLPVFPTNDHPYPGAVILEIKYDDYIAAHVAHALQTSGMPQAASKYCLCRDMLHLSGQRWHLPHENNHTKESLT